MSKKKIEIIKNEFIENNFTKITLDNIKDFFNYKTLFVVLDIKSGAIVNQFAYKERFIKNNSHISYSVRDNKIISYEFIIRTTQLEEDYLNSVSDLKKLIKDYIKIGSLYGKQI